MNSPFPIRDVVLFSSGVGYFQHSGEIQGPTSLPFSFRTEQINDLLKSLVLFDPAGQVQPVTYTSHDPVSRGLAGFGIDLKANLSMASLLRQFQGASVSVSTADGGAEGQIVSVSSESMPVKETDVPVDVLNLLTSAGLTAFPLPDVREVKFLDETLETKFRDALSLLASGLDKQRKTVAINFGGERRREVRMGYLLEAPVWKTSYRLVLNEKKAPYLQGWAVVENTTDEDWKDVRLSLVSGRPISFVQDLYTPLYVTRPTVQPQVVGSPMPQLHAGALEEDEDEEDQEDFAFSMEAASGPMGERPEVLALAMPASEYAMREELPRTTLARRRQIGKVVDRLAKSVASQAQGAERGELFEYAIAQPVTLPRHEAAMVPIVSSDIEGEKLSLFNPQVNPTHPMNAVKLKNTSGLHLSGGPLTVFDEGVYAGDGQIEDLQPDEERLISYAVDLAVEGKLETKSVPQQHLSVRADNGMLHITRKQRIEHHYTFRNKDKAPRVVMVEQPIQPDWDLVQPARADETAAALYRFRVTVPEKGTETFLAVAEQPLYETLSLFDTDVSYLLSWAQNTQLSEPLRGALQQIVELRRRMKGHKSRRGEAEEEIKAIDQDQARIRGNMKTLDKGSDLYDQYVRKFTQQEARVEELRAEIRRLQADEKAAGEELRNFLDILNVA